MSDSNTKIYHVRVEGIAGRYGLGEEIVPNVHLFKDGYYNLSKEELVNLIARTGRKTQ